MGLIFIRVEIANPEKPKRWVEVEGLIDTGVIYSVVPAETLEELGIKPVGEKVFTLANGEHLIRKYGNALFRYRDSIAASPVVFGEEGDHVLIGMLTLEALGYTIDPLKLELKPMRMLLV